MIRSGLLLTLVLAACAGGRIAPPQPLPDTRAIIEEARPFVASDSLAGRWAIVAVNGMKTDGLWLDFGGEGIGTITRTDNGILVGSPQPRTQAFLGCNNWHANGWIRNGDKLALGTEMSSRTERGCDPATMTLDDQAYAVLREAMTMEVTLPRGLRLINDHGTVDLVREGQ